MDQFSVSAVVPEPALPPGLFKYFRSDWHADAFHHPEHVNQSSMVDRDNPMWRTLLSPQNIGGIAADIAKRLNCSGGGGGAAQFAPVVNHEMNQFIGSMVDYRPALETAAEQAAMVARANATVTTLAARRAQGLQFQDRYDKQRMDVGGSDSFANSFRRNPSTAGAIPHQVVFTNGAHMSRKLGTWQRNFEYNINGPWGKMDTGGFARLGSADAYNR